MSRWKALPTELDPRVRRLVVCLRRLKDHSGLGVRQLSARTGYSPKSWERYLSGGSLPPAAAVEALARTGGEDPARLLALREVAAEAWGEGGPAAVPREPVPPDPGPRPPAPDPGTGARLPLRALHVALVAGTLTLVMALSSAVLVAVRLTDHGGGAARTAPVAVSAQAYTCRPERLDGRWYAGISRTREAALGDGDTGPDVAEAQCLLRRAGLTPGDVDGVFGPLTRRAVEGVQRRSGLVVTGTVGRDTWKALRR